MRLLVWVAASGVAAAVAYAAQFKPLEFLSVLATALIISAGSAVAGAFIGFLFALPRARRADNETRARNADDPAASDYPLAAGTDPQREPATTANTNLDDISDWLTKILVS